MIHDILMESTGINMEFDGRMEDNGGWLFFSFRSYKGFACFQQYVYVPEACFFVPRTPLHPEGLSSLI
jgi:hypothetical protein